MKVSTLKPLIFCAVFLLVLLGLQSCKDSSDPVPVTEPEQEILQKLAASWNVSSASLDDVSQDGYTAFTLTLKEDKTYTVSGAPKNSPWPAFGIFSFGNDISSVIVRDQGTINATTISYQLTENQLNFTFTFSGDGFVNGRTSGVEGEWKFEFQKN